MVKENQTFKLKIYPYLPTNITSLCFFVHFTALVMLCHNTRQIEIIILLELMIKDSVEQSIFYTNIGK